MKQKRIKKVLSLLLCFLFVALLFPARGLGAVARLKGDVTGDGYVKVDDARFCLRRAIGLEKYAAGSIEYKACDYDGDNNVTVTDARLILREAIGLGGQKFSVPMTVFSGPKYEIRLTGYKTKYDSERGETVLVCTFSITNKDVVPFDPNIDAITVNGLQISENDLYGRQVHPNSTVTMDVLITRDYFDISQSGNAVVDELLMRFNMFDISTRKWSSVKVALYPTNKSAGSAVRYAADRVKYSPKHTTSDFIWGYQIATFHNRVSNGVKYVNDLVALYYFKNTSNRDLYLKLTDIRLNDSVKFENDVEIYVFAGTAAQPEIYMDGNFFAWHEMTTVSNLKFTITVYDTTTGNSLYSSGHTVSWK